MNNTYREGFQRTAREQKKREREWKKGHWGRVERAEIERDGSPSVVTKIYKEFHFAPSVEERFPATANFLAWGERVRRHRREVADTLFFGSAGGNVLGAILLAEGHFLPAAVLLAWGIPSFFIAMKSRKRII